MGGETDKPQMQMDHQGTGVRLPPPGTLGLVHIKSALIWTVPPLLWDRPVVCGSDSTILLLIRNFKETRIIPIIRSTNDGAPGSFSACSVDFNFAA